MLTLDDLCRATKNHRLSLPIQRSCLHALLRRAALELANFEFAHGSKHQASRAAALHTVVTLALEGEKHAAEREKPALSAV